jgi:hypothetical protein
MSNLLNQLHKEEAKDDIVHVPFYFFALLETGHSDCFDNYSHMLFANFFIYYNKFNDLNFFYTSKIVMYIKFIV